MALNTDLAIKNWKPSKPREVKPCGHRDGLYIRANASGEKTFYWRKGSFYRLGDYPILTLSKARAMAAVCNEQAKLGVEPEAVIAALRGAGSLTDVASMDAEKIAAASRSLVRTKAPSEGKPTFDRVFHDFYSAYAESNLQAGPSRKQPLSLHRDHVPASLKAMPIDEIKRSDIFPWLLKLLRDKHETARRLRNQLERTFEFAINCGHCEANPVPNRRAFEIKKPKAKSHGTLDYTRLPALWRWLETRSLQPKTVIAVRLLILSAHRVGVVLAARWEHFDLDAGTWTIPERRDNQTKGLMKSGRSHRVTLPRQFVDELKNLRGNSEFVFSSPSVGGHLTENALLKALKAFDEEITAHGFRNTFKTWARSQSIPDWIADAYVDHGLKGLDASYRREDPARIIAECAKVTERLYQYVQS